MISTAIAIAPPAAANSKRKVDIALIHPIKEAIIHNPTEIIIFTQELSKIEVSSKIS
jgi:hypothetical protein